LSEIASVYLDDANRVGEKTILKKWEDEFNIKFNISGFTLTHASKGRGFYVNPI